MIKCDICDSRVIKSIKTSRMISSPIGVAPDTTGLCRFVQLINRIINSSLIKICSGNTCEHTFCCVPVPYEIQSIRKPVVADFKDIRIRCSSLNTRAAVISVYSAIIHKHAEAIVIQIAIHIMYIFFTHIRSVRECEYSANIGALGIRTYRIISKINTLSCVVDHILTDSCLYKISIA